jgi:Na+-translocating ferredoxin:NAD+ oxidoreductase RnfD subunit
MALLSPSFGPLMMRSRASPFQMPVMTVTSEPGHVVRHLVGLLVDVDLALLPALGAEHLVAAVALVAQRAVEVEVAHLAAAVVLRVREEQPAVVERSSQRQ